jgi:hypothetical protein
MGLGRIFFLLIILAAHGIFAQDNAPKYSNEFLNIGVGARSFALGLSTVSYADDANAGYWNPAGLTRLKPAYQASLMHSAYFAGIANYDFASVAAAIDTLSFASISVLRFSVDDIPDTRFLFDRSGNLNYDNIRFFSSSDYAVLLSYGRIMPKFGNVRVGGSAKIIRRIVGDFASSWGFGLDLGAQRSFGKWDVGITGKDLFGTFNSWSYNMDELGDIYSQTGNALPNGNLEVSLPRLILGLSRNVSVGEKFTLMGTMDVAATFDGKRNTLVKTDLVSLDPYGGFELGYRKVAFLRLGISQFQQIKDFDNSLSWTFQPSMGLGFILNELTIDYAFTDVGDQSAGLYSHVFSIKADFHSNEK